MTADGPLLLYDGVCALCNGAVRFVIKRDRTRTLRFAPLQGVTAKRLLEGRPELRGIDSMIFLAADGTALTRSRAAEALGRYLGGRWAASRTGVGTIVAIPARAAQRPPR